MEQAFLSSEQGVFIQLDPRTKIYMLMVINVIMITSITEGVAIYLKPGLAFLVFLFILNARRPKAAFIYAALYIVSYKAEFILTYISGISTLGFIVRLFSHIITRMVPGTMFAYYVLTTTKVSEFVASMERMHISQKLIIPFAVMFRFFPTIVEEYRSIQDAMRLKGINFRKGLISMLEYRWVPLIISIVKIGDELSAASLTRGLGCHIKRTNYCYIGLSILDGVFAFIMTGIIIIYFAI